MIFFVMLFYERPAGFGGLGKQSVQWPAVGDYHETQDESGMGKRKAVRPPTALPESFIAGLLV